MSSYDNTMLSLLIGSLSTFDSSSILRPVFLLNTSILPFTVLFFQLKGSNLIMLGKSYKFNPILSCDCLTLTQKVLEGGVDDGDFLLKLVV